jgi:hypothetical protein
MTIYMLKWKNTENNTFHVHACSSYVKAQAMLKDLNKMENAEVIPHTPEEIIGKYTPKSQAEVIDLINNLL